jgi:hypothetical protein
MRRLRVIVAALRRASIFCIGPAACVRALRLHPDLPVVTNWLCKRFSERAGEAATSCRKGLFWNSYNLRVCFVSFVEAFVDNPDNPGMSN